MTVNACAKDWENNLCFDADLALESYYYNNRVSEWEPLIEPIEENSVFKPWTLKLSVRKGEAKAGVADSTETDMYSYETGSQSEISTTESFSGIENDAKMTVTLSSTKTLQFTVTKTCLSVLKTLADDLTGSKSWGASLDENTRKQAEGIELRNLTGFNATITPGYAFDRKFEKFTLLDKGSEFLSLRESFVRVEGDKVINQRTVYLQPERTVFADKVMFTCKVNKYAELCDIPVARAGKQLFGIKRVKDGIMSLVLDTEVIGNRKIVTIRSSLQVKNSLEFAIQLYSSEDRQLHHLATIHPNDIASVPLSATYDSKLFITPIVDGILFNSHKEPVDWKVLYAMKAQDSSRKASKVYLCKSDSGHQFVFKVKMRSENYHSVDRMKLPVERLQDSTPHFVLNVTPSIVLRNALPYAISYRLEGSGKHEVLKEGKKCSLYSVIPTAKQVIQIELLDYLGMNWHGSFAINNIVMGSTDKQGLILTSKNIKDKTVGVDGRTVVEHPPSVNPIIFSTNSKNFFSSGKISCSVPGFTKWSDGFSIDAVGNAGCIQCHNLKDKNLFEIGISSSLSNFGLTKFVKFSPFHVISNQTNYAITCMESGVNNPYSVMVPAGKVIPFWPSNGKVKMRITAGTGRIYSPPFKFNVDNSFLLKLDNEIGAINASVQILESSNIISFYPYTSGSVPALLINRLSNLTIEYRQSNESLNHKLEPGTHRYYALDYPSGPSKICWWISGREKETESKKVNIVENQLADHTVKGQKMYCISFLDGLQREVRLERRDIDVHINVHGIGLSLVNDRIGVEIAYISMSSSTCEWKYKNKKGRWQELKGEISQRIENAWLNYQQMIARGQEVSEEVILNEDFKVNFRKMIMIRNHDHPIKRLYSPGIAIEYGKSPSQQYFSVTVNNIQVDNQRSYPYFPVVFCPVPPPKYASEEIAAQPFIQLCVIVKEEERADFKQIQYLRLLIQEMKIQVDRGFIMDMIDIFQERIMPNEDDLFKKDLDYLNSSEVQSDTVSVDEKLKDYYQDLHLSPIKLDLSFSINEGAQTSTNHTDDFVMNSAILDVAINTVGSAATSVRDAQFRLSYFERRNMFYSRKQLISQTIEYYRNQFIQQAYMVVFGLDALGNPSHLFNDFKTGIQDFFYEPYQGAVTGPAEFFEGLGHGVTGLLGHTIGGTFSAASRITDTVGKGFAALSMDKEYQRERQKASSSKPSDLGEGLLRGGKGFAKGLWSGVSGIVTKPIEGAEKEGVSGFFKGVGKGLIGSIAKPTGGVVDMATSTFQGIKSMSGIDKELNRIRPARFIHRDNVIRAYDNHEAQGNHILKGMSKDAFGYDNLQEDAYVAHAFVDRMNRKLIMITTKRILKAEILTENELWKCSWQCNFDDMEELPTSTKENITIMEKKSGLFGVSTVSTKVIDCGTSEIAMWLLLRIKTALDYSKLQFSF
ncbi:Vacuolar protein sorting-associated protein 13C [Trichoplax sp. H2]|nr:Vacuolar protein sorting-associated protein 13C [Trichoplax sp. H2]|eukprot:RDD43391.1 Vacuolar protein sorting-associated protein 13C [Trichoplax sp. H2]